MPDLEKFACTRCGACCMDISTVPELSDFALPSGRCKNLGDDRKTCMIYETRPLLCRVDDLGRSLRMGPTWIAMMHLACQVQHEKVYGVPQEPLNQECQH